MRVALFVPALLGTALLSPAHAQTEPAPAEPAFEVVGAEAIVTAGRLPAAPGRTGRNVSVITAADIAASPARSLDELLRFEAGVQVTPRSAFGAQADLSVRGGTFNGVVVLVDGARFNDPQTGHFLSDFPIPLAEIARIEIVRGPDAAAWGPDALGGVVHVITHTGAAGSHDGHEGGARDVAAASASAGGLGTVAGEVAVRRLRAPAAFSAAVTGLRTDGAPLRAPDGSTVVGSQGEVRADLDRVAATAAAALPVAGASLTVRGALDARDFGAVQFYTPLASDTAREATTTQWLQARLVRSGRTGWSVQASARRHTDRFAFFPGLDPNRHTSRRLGLTAEAHRLVSPRLTVGAGASGEVRDVVSNSLGDHRDAGGGVFALARWTPLDPVTVSASARVDADPGFGVEPTPMLAVAVQAAPGLVLRGAAGRAVRAPNYTERYINTARELRSGNLGNPDLRAERAWSAEAGLDGRLGPLAVQATGFWRRTDDLIDYARTTVEGIEVFLAQNILATTARGVETSAQVGWRFNPDQALRAVIGYAWTDVQVAAGAVPGDFRYVLDHSPHLVQGRATATLGQVETTVEAIHKTRVEQDAVTVANARLAVALGGSGGVSAAEVFGEVRNAFDATYTEVFGAPMPGRLWLGGVRLALGEGR